MKAIKYSVMSAIALVIIALFLCISKIKEQKEEIRRLDNNIEVITGESRQFKTEAGKNASEKQALQIKANELEMYSSRLAKEVESLNIKLRDVKAATTVETKTEYKIVTKTVIDTVPGTYKFAWRDSYTKISGVCTPDSTKLDVSSVDTIDVITSYKQKRFLFFRIGKPKITVVATNKDPKTDIFVKNGLIAD